MDNISATFPLKEKVNMTFPWFCGMCFVIIVLFLSLIIGSIPFLNWLLYLCCAYSSLYAFTCFTDLLLCIFGISWKQQQSLVWEKQMKDSEFHDIEWQDGLPCLTEVTNLTEEQPLLLEVWGQAASSFVRGAWQWESTCPRVLHVSVLLHCSMMCHHTFKLIQTEQLVSGNKKTADFICIHTRVKGPLNSRVRRRGKEQEHFLFLQKYYLCK